MGYRDFAYGSPAGSGWVDPDLSPTASKPQSKLWFAQGTWWGVLNERVSNDFHIYSLNPSTQAWTDTGVLVDSRNGSRADALWDGEKLYVASARPSGTGTANGIQITRYSFVNGRYVRDAGFPVTVGSGGVEAVVIAKDTTGKLWATFTQSTKVRVAVSQPGGQSWGAPFSPAVSGTTVTSDDLSTITSYDGQVSVIWSNQNDGTIYAATHVDGTATTTWQASRKAVTGPGEADDHINLRSVEGDAAGRLFVAVKTSQNDGGGSNAPLVYLLVLGVDNTWRKHIAYRVSDGVTRPIVLIDRANRMLRMFAAGPETGGVVYAKSSPLDAIAFASGKGNPFIKLASDKNINNPTSTKQNLTAETGLVVLASDQNTGRYVHNTMSLGTPPPPTAPTAAYTASPTLGDAPLPVSFTDQSTGGPTTWSWDFGDGGTSSSKNPSHTYTTPGTYTVNLTVTNTGGSDSEVKSGLITVTEPSEPPPGSSYPESLLADNPVGYWRLGDTGSTVAAVVGPPGTTSGGVVAAPGVLTDNGARSFNGSTGYVSVPSTAALNATGDLALEAWVKPSVVQSGVVMQKGGTSGYSVWQYRLGMTSGGQWRGTVFVGSTAYAVTAPGSAGTGVWTHLALVRSGSTLSIYVNGQLASSAPAPGVLNSTSSMLALGRSGASATSYFAGAIDEVAVYDHAIPAASVASRYAAGEG